MAHPKADQVRQLHELGRTYRQIAEELGMSTKTVTAILKEKEPKPLSIQATGQQWTAKLNPWIRLIHQAAVEQIDECRDVSLDDFIWYCCDFVKTLFKLTPPGWALETEPALDLSEPEGWELPQVKAAVRIIEEAQKNGKQTPRGSEAPQSQIPNSEQQPGK